MAQTKPFKPSSPSPNLSVHQLSWMLATNHSTNSCWASGLGKFSFKNMNSQYNEAMESGLADGFGFFFFFKEKNCEGRGEGRSV